MTVASDNKPYLYNVYKDTHTLCAYGIGEIPASFRLIVSINLIVECHLMEKRFSERSVQVTFPRGLYSWNEGSF